MATNASETESCSSAKFRYQPKVRVAERYKLIGFIAEGGFGQVYKAGGRDGRGVFAIKKIKPGRKLEQDQQQGYTGVSQSTIREISLCSELSHENIITLVEVILEDKCVFIVFEYADHDLHQIISCHRLPTCNPIPPTTIKSIMFQLLNGCQYLHANWVFHRDLKPQNILITSAGRVKIGDFGLARLFNNPPVPLHHTNVALGTTWYRAPEVIFGSWHYTTAVDMWAVGCIFGEILFLHALFGGDREQTDDENPHPFSGCQLHRILTYLGLPTQYRWPLLSSMPWGQNLCDYGRIDAVDSVLEGKYKLAIAAPSPLEALGEAGYKLLSGLLEWNPEHRTDAKTALNHEFFKQGEELSGDCFEQANRPYPQKPVSPVTVP